ncbi:hypothetical protein E2C01_022575 [Portunus trituberculatus]|uniref:Uncharacterized protein n=1 Tax=Portunus trituberculatus TaxID=210409 RepID=A0A5B7E7N2_PORTR|nr:hypothetical protein [Portunus trituberculatus]
MEGRPESWKVKYLAVFIEAPKHQTLRHTSGHCRKSGNNTVGVTVKNHRVSVFPWAAPHHTDHRQHTAASPGEVGEGQDDLVGLQEALYLAAPEAHVVLHDVEVLHQGPVRLPRRALQGVLRIFRVP